AGLAGRGGPQRLVAILVGFFVLLGGFGWVVDRMRQEAGQGPTELRMVVEEGLSAPVEILWDDRGIGHVEARVEGDAWLGLGLLHGRDRGRQMLWLRRLAQGRAAEVLGEEALPSDRLMRTLGIVEVAQREWERLDPDTAKVLQAYARGVNLGLGIAGAPLKSSSPGPFSSSGRSKADWEPVDSLMLSKLVAWQTSNGIRTGLVLDDLIRSLGGRLARLFRPSGLVGDEAITDSSEIPILPGVGTDGQHPPEPSDREVLDAARIFGATAWVLDGAYTQSGAPIMVADYQLAPTAPLLFYEAQIQGGALDVAGATIPGIPVFWAGRNQALAWATIPAGAITADLYKETVRESDGTYHDGESWVRLEQRVENIDVAAPTGPREEELTIRATRHGPLVDDLFETPLLSRSPSRAPHSLAWTGLRSGNGLASLLAVAKASDAEGLVKALGSHHEPAVAVVYADRSGEAGMQWAGWLPRRTLPSSLVPVPGRMRIYDWRGPIPFAELPISRLASGPSENGLSERVWVAVADGGFSEGLSRAEIEWSWQPGVRQRRLERILAELTAAEPDRSLPDRNGQRLDLRTAANLTRDFRDVEAAEVVPALTRLAEAGPPLRPEAREILQILSRWDGDMSPSSQGAAAYAVLIQTLFDSLFRPVLGDELLERYLDLPGVRPQSLLALVLVAADRRMEVGGWTDRDRVIEAVRHGLRKTWVVLSQRLGPDREDWQWSRLHALVFKPFFPAGPDTQSMVEVGVGGGDATLASTGFGVSEDFATDRAALYQMAVDLSAPDRMLTTLAPGQSERPDSLHFDDGLERWRNGRPGLLLMSRVLVEDEATARVLLEPPS
ncbi:MAG: penicillin acylase family protein, partial [Myxococcota bacterium]|nr:penicillin acylase family protein [Myxococcota bacterium]